MRLGAMLPALAVNCAVPSTVKHLKFPQQAVTSHPCQLLPFLVAALQAQAAQQADERRRHHQQRAQEVVKALNDMKTIKAILNTYNVNTTACEDKTATCRLIHGDPCLVH